MLEEDILRSDVGSARGLGRFDGQEDIHVPIVVSNFCITYFKLKINAVSLLKRRVKGRIFGSKAILVECLGYDISPII